ncbi:uncharacterized protein LOC132611715 [Lycium barbarum]|uniref:uncharacterized protein LOC132611715 n=1 Tax=Lycium barbarum TaxID=112863 RepID=UPI00293F5D9D|nr:uncharacterized protein LOC132611715 [Lycium barbarum]
MGALERLKTLKANYKLSIIILLEPVLQDPPQIGLADSVKRQLGMDHCYCNMNNKIWILWSNSYEIVIIDDCDQIVSASVRGLNNNELAFLSAVYAKCDSNLRQELWESIESFSSDLNAPWAVLGDFNVIVEADEKKGGRPFNISESFDFLNCMEDSGLQDAGFLGSSYTWCDNRGQNAIWKRLDRVLINAEWTSSFDFTTVNHLPSTGSDHAPLLVNCQKEDGNPIKFFKFLNLWVDHSDFLNVVQQAWEENIYGNPLWILHQKLKRTSKVLSVWSRATFGDIYEEVTKMESKIADLENNLLVDNSPKNGTLLNHANAEYIIALKRRDSLLKQKARIKWLAEGDVNSAFFHNTIKGRRRRLSIHQIKNRDGDWIFGNQDIANAGIQHFQELFSSSEGDPDHPILDLISPIVTNQDNIELNSIPTIQQIKEAVFCFFFCAEERGKEERERERNEGTGVGDKRGTGRSGGGG